MLLFGSNMQRTEEERLEAGRAEDHPRDSCAGGFRRAGGKKNEVLLPSVAAFAAMLRIGSTRAQQATSSFFIACCWLA